MNRTLARDVRGPDGNDELKPAVSEASGLLEGGFAKALRLTSSPARSSAWRHSQTSATAIIANAKRLTALGSQPLVKAAHRRVAVAVMAASLPASYPLLGKSVSQKVKSAALKRRRRLKPGQLELLFPKASTRIKVRLYDDRGAMRPEAYAKLTTFLCDPHQGRGGEDPYLAYEPRLFAILYFVAQHFDRPIVVTSAYRTTRRTRSSSNHTKGRAIDFVVQKVPRRRLLAYVERSFTHIGVGWYPRSTFIHVDVRRASYYWVDRSRPGRRQRPHKRRIRRKPRPGTDPTLATVHLSPKTLYRRR